MRDGALFGAWLEVATTAESRVCVGGKGALIRLEPIYVHPMYVHICKEQQGCWVCQHEHLSDETCAQFARFSYLVK